MKKILIVEDTDQIREEVKDILLMEGYQVLEAINGRDALDKINKQLPDLVITDVLMPEMDGFELLEELNKNNKIKVPVIVLSARADSKDKEKGISLGAIDYLVKPCSPEILIDAVEKAMNNN